MDTVTDRARKLLQDALSALADPAGGEAWDVVERRLAARIAGR
jgi:hypothetical protein